MKSTAPSATARLTLVLALTALLPFSLGYFLSYLFRAVNAVVAPDLVKELSLSASELGVLTAAYLFAFALFQLPLGVLLDRYGPRRVQAALLAVAAVGTALFAIGTTTPTLTFARALIGLGFAGGLMSGFKAVVIWVPEQNRAFASSCVMSLGALGLMLSTAPMEYLIAWLGWRTMFGVLAVATLAVAALVFLAVPKQHALSAPAPLKDQAASVWRILKDPAFLRLAPLLGLSAGTHIAIQTLWASPWWRDIGGLDRAGVAAKLFWMAFAFFVGILATGAITDWFVRRGYSVLDVMIGFMAAFLASQALIIADVEILRLPAWLLFGMLGQVAVLAFPWLSTYYGAALSGRANSTMNLMIFATAFIAQATMGWIIDQFPRTPSGGYTETAYRAAFGTFFALEMLGLLWYLLGHRRLRHARAQPL